MSYNGSGVYTLPGDALANGEIVSATENNQFRNDVAAALNVAWTRDGQAPATGNIPMGSHKLTGLLAGNSATDSANLLQVQSGASQLIGSISGADTITGAVTPALTAYTTGQTFRFVSAGANTGAVTLNIDSAGAKSVTKLGTTALAAGDIPSGSIVEVVYDGTQFQLVGLVASTATTATTATNLAGGAAGQVPVQSAAGTTTFMDSSFAFKNRIINGAMMIDQRNAGASVTPTTTNTYALDRWNCRLTVASKYSVQQNAGAVTPPAGFTKYLGVTSLSSYSVGASDAFNINQRIEGLNVADFAWGTASASAATLSFKVYSSLTGTFGGVVGNANGDRSYPFTYTILSANTWTAVSVTIPGDTTGTWATDNGTGIQIYFNLGAGSSQSGTAGAWNSSFNTSATGATSVVGTNGATFYITGVQLEKGSTATSFDYRPYGTELALCQRYYFKVLGDDNAYMFGGAYADSATRGFAYGAFPVTLRIAPSALEQNGTAGNYYIRTGGTDRVSSAVPAFNSATTQYAWQIESTVASGQTAGQGGYFYGGASGAYLAWSAEL